MPSNASSLTTQLLDLVEPLRGLMAELDPREVPVSFAPAAVEAFATIERLAAAGRLSLAARAAQAKRDRQIDPERWLADLTGTSNGRARSDLETSKRLEDLDATSDALRHGQLSGEQAAAVSDAAAVNPDAEQDLLDIARRESLKKTREEAARRRAEAESEEAKAERDRRVRRERRLRFWYGNGAGNLTATGPVAEVKELEQLIQRHVDGQFRSKRDPAVRASRQNYAFDA